MSQGSVPLLYRHILRAAKRFPSVKREGILREIKTEFHANKACSYSPASLGKPHLSRWHAACTVLHAQCCMQGSCPFMSGLCKRRAG
jgi:hypothetical protein